MNSSQYCTKVQAAQVLLQQQKAMSINDKRPPFCSRMLPWLPRAKQCAHGQGRYYVHAANTNNSHHHVLEDLCGRGGKTAFTTAWTGAQPSVTTMGYYDDATASVVVQSVRATGLYCVFFYGEFYSSSRSALNRADRASR